MIIRVAFYKGKGRIIDTLVRFFDGQPYSHCEFLFDEDLCFSADGWTNQVRYQRIRLNPENWDFKSYTITSSQYVDAVRFANAIERSKYDYAGLFGFVIPFIKQSSKRWYCSETSLKLLNIMGLFTHLEGIKLSPNGLFKRI